MGPSRTRTTLASTRFIPRLAWRSRIGVLVRVVSAPRGSSGTLRPPSDADGISPHRNRYFYL